MKRSAKKISLTFLINGKQVDNPGVIADHFNEYFIKIGQALDRKIPKSHTPLSSFLNGTFDISINLEPCTEQEVNKIINELKESAPGWDEISSSLLKETKEHYIKALVHIIYLSLSQGIFPS